MGDLDSSVEIGIGNPCIGLGATIYTATAALFVQDDAVQDDNGDRCIQMKIYTSTIRELQQPEVRILTNEALKI